MFGRVIPLEYYLRMCTDMFGDSIDTTYVTLHVAQIGYVFPTPWNYTVTNAVLPNGDYDPWSSLGTTVTLNNQHQFAPLTHGAAHCSDMYPSRSGEPTALEATRVIVRREVDYYINSAAMGTTQNPATPTNGGATDASGMSSSTVGGDNTSSTSPATSTINSGNVYTNLIPTLLVAFIALLIVN